MKIKNFSVNQHGSTEIGIGSMGLSTLVGNCTLREDNVS